MISIKERFGQLRGSERGAVAVVFISIVVVLIVVTGLVVDSAGKYQTAQSAQMLAASAARAGSNSLAASAVIDGSLELNDAQAIATAEEYLSAAGVAGSASVVGDTITVTVADSYQTRFLSIIGINHLDVSATASAQLITQ